MITIINHRDVKPGRFLSLSIAGVTQESVKIETRIQSATDPVAYLSVKIENVAVERRKVSYDIEIPEKLPQWLIELEDEMEIVLIITEGDGKRPVKISIPLFME